MNRLYFGDNLKWLSDRKEFPGASVDLVIATRSLTRTPIMAFFSVSQVASRRRCVPSPIE